MGGKGSGRKPDPVNMLTGSVASVGSEELTIPNYSGMQKNIDDGITSLKLNQMENPDGDKTFNMTSRQLKFLWTNPSGNPMELEASGAYTGSLLHIHQHTGNPSSAYLMELESSDTDVEHVKSTLPSANIHSYCTYITGDSSERFYLNADGAMYWGDGTTQDTNLYRNAANTLKTDDTFVCAGLLTSGDISGANLLASGNISGAVIYGDGSNLTGITGGDNLGNHIATQTISGSYIFLSGAGLLIHGKLGNGVIEAKQNVFGDGEVTVSDRDGIASIHFDALGHSYFNVTGGDLAIGHTAPNKKLDVGGDISGAALVLSKNINTKGVIGSSTISGAKLYSSSSIRVDGAAYFNDLLDVALDGDVGGAFTAGTIEADNGYTGSFTEHSGKTVTVSGGIILSVAS
jgi:hypothetical protein